MAQMSATTAQPLRASRRQQQQTGYREERRKLLEVFVARKITSQKQRVPDKRPEIRSNRGLQKKSEQIRPFKKMAEPVNKENIHPAVNKGGKTVTLTLSYLKTKQMKDERVKLVPTKDEPKPAIKPVLGTYKGKIVQSKINSFRKNSDNKDRTEQNNPMPKSHLNRPQSSATVPPKTLVRPASNDVKPKRPGIPPVSSQIRPSSALTKNKSEPVTVRRTTQVLTQLRPIQQKAQPLKSQLKTDAKKSNPVMPSKKTSAPVKTLPEPQKNKPAPPLPTAGKFPSFRESAAERKARLAEWRQSKGKVVKRPPMAVVLSSTCSVHKEKPEIKTEPEETKETRQLYWATMAEEDEQELFTLKIHQIFEGCQKLIDEGCSREEVLSILEKQIQNLPEAKQLSGYWECLARLEKRDGRLYKVIAVCEEAVSAGAQPLEELRAILADALEQLKPDPEESVKKENEDDLKMEEFKTEVQDETETAIKGKRRGKVSALKNEPQSLSTPGKPPMSESTLEDGAAASSVIRYNVCSTPHLEKMKKLQMNERDSGIKSYKFLTPVRRSSRLEHKSHRLPNMLKDHDPCVSGIDQLGDLDGTETCANAYIFRKNSALNESIPKNEPLAQTD
ncbi:cytoskeleton-associated protein 2 [Phyllobates terribilis]|uniref:cytoskeleton-associated protein 2 n=1 Tax=Phyllobates terribilis TaxID=111132 RepID=UPI003CCB6957